MSHVDTIFRAGDDALGNQFEINFTAFSLLAEVDKLKIRTTTVDIPEFSVESYTVDYKTQRFTKPSGKISTPNEFSFSFRADKYWVLYQALLAWNQYVADNRTGAMAEDVGAITGNANFRTDISVIPTDSNDVVTAPGWTMEKCYPSNVAGVSFDTASGDPLIITVTMQMLKMVPRI